MKAIKISILFALVAMSLVASAQFDTDHAYAKPLKEVLTDIEKKYGVTIRYPDSIVAGKTLNYAEWRYRNDVEQTLNNVLAPFDMKARTDGEKRYKLGY
ncbi:MAG: hypothetical protein ABIR18_15290 [Chitinophagaceae bacterium]